MKNDKSANSSDLDCELILTGNKKPSICAVLPRSSNGKTTDSDSDATAHKTSQFRNLDGVCSPRQTAALHSNCELIPDKTQHKHSALIDAVNARYSGSMRKDFPDSVKAALKVRDQDDLPRFDFRPDAFHIDDTSKTITLFEVEITHGIDDAKMQKLAWFWFCLDCIYWDCRLIIVDQRGIEREIDLCDQYYNFMQINIANEGSRARLNGRHP